MVWEFDGGNIREISALLQDDISRMIFSNRIMYSMTKEDGYLRNIISTTVEGQTFLGELTARKNQKKIIWGTGKWAQWIYKIFSVFQWECFVDNYPKEMELMGLRVISVEEMLKEYVDACIFVSPRYCYKEIYKQLIDLGYKQKNIILLGEMIDKCAAKIYFDEKFLSHDEHEVFIDCGAFDGSTVLDFVKWSDCSYEAIYAFEPSRQMAHQCRERCKDISGLKLLNNGLWKKDTLLYFIEAGSESYMTEALDDSMEGDAIPAIAMDEMVYKEKIKPTYIKMDIEGAEMKALQGGSECIAKYFPKLAISVYHKPEDIMTIPMYLHKINSQYRFWIRHYSLSQFDTVLYAIC